MKKLSTLAALAALSLAFSLAAGTALADTVVTKDGSKFVGKVTQIDGASVVLATGAAGDVKIKTAEITSLATDAPINVRLADGTVALGSATMSAPGTLVVATAKGPVSADIGKVTQTWAAGAKDPELVKRERHWNYEAGTNIAGRTGNAEQFSASLSFRATLKSSFDTLQLYTGYDYGRQTAKTPGAPSVATKSADQGRAGADYQNNFSGRYSWYARDELGFDRVKNISLYNTAAAGFGYDIVKTAVDTLTFRAGLAHLYQRYSTAGASNMSTLALDTGLFHDLKMKTWSMHNQITWTPSTKNFNTCIIAHESHIELPLADPHWKFNIGISNVYQTPIPPGAIKRLDTTYFARLILSWK